ncbi:uncharacterized protein [Lepisosteus oculatus]|uniref:uncharacterized protein isoform X2 n=1 Tax=Lepisosteus oculatus TaxID=7918 RepID=UPI0035F52976
MRLSWSLPFLCLWVSLAANQGTPPPPGRRAPPQAPPLPPEPARSVKVLVSEGCPQADEQGPAPDALELEPGAPLVLTHRINLVPSCPGGAGPDLTALRQRLERLEGELSELREKCTAQGGCCSEQRTATGPGSCAPQGCPDDCSDQGRCEEGRCVCFPGFTGPSCGVRSCPAGCHGRGQCVEGRCVCDGGFTGEDCSRPRCPGDCSGRGSCTRGRCQCRPGYGGPDCSQSVAPPTTATPPPGCPGNCGDRGRCVQGECVCDAGFTGVDCSTVVPVVLQLNTSNITDSSVTLTWTRPTAPVDSYHITFSSGKESDQKVTSQVRGGLTTYTQTGLAPAQEYRVSVRAEKDRRQGAESSTHFRTLISGPKNLHVVKTTTSSVIIQWDRSVSVIDRYRLTYVPSDGRSPAQEMTLPRDKSSAHLPQLQAGLQYNVTLWAERGRGRSPPVTVQATPGTPSAPPPETVAKAAGALARKTPKPDLYSGRDASRPADSRTAQPKRPVSRAQDRHNGTGIGPGKKPGPDPARTPTQRGDPDRSRAQGAGRGSDSGGGLSPGSEARPPPARSDVTVLVRESRPAPQPDPEQNQDGEQDRDQNQDRPGPAVRGSGTESLEQSRPELPGSAARDRGAGPVRAHRNRTVGRAPPRLGQRQSQGPGPAHNQSRTGPAPGATGPGGPPQRHRTGMGAPGDASEEEGSPTSGPVSPHPGRPRPVPDGDTPVSAGRRVTPRLPAKGTPGGPPRKPPAVSAETPRAASPSLPLSPQGDPQARRTSAVEQPDRAGEGPSAIPTPAPGAGATVSPPQGAQDRDGGDKGPSQRRPQEPQDREGGRPPQKTQDRDGEDERPSQRRPQEAQDRDGGDKRPSQRRPQEPQDRDGGDKRPSQRRPQEPQDRDGGDKGPSQRQPQEAHYRDGGDKRPSQRRPQEAQDRDGGDKRPSQKRPQEPQDREGGRPPQKTQDQDGEDKRPSQRRPQEAQDRDGEDERPSQRRPQEPQDREGGRPPQEAQDRDRGDKRPPSQKRPQEAQDQDGKDKRPSQRRPQEAQDRDREGGRPPQEVQDRDRGDKRPLSQKRPQEAQDQDGKDKRPSQRRPQKAQDRDGEDKGPPQRQPQEAQDREGGRPPQEAQDRDGGDKGPSQKRPQEAQDQDGEDKRPSQRRPQEAQDRDREGGRPPQEAQDRDEGDKRPSQRQPQEAQDRDRGDKRPPQRRPQEPQDRDRGDKRPSQRRPQEPQDRDGGDKRPSQRRPQVPQDRDDGDERPSQRRPQEAEDRDGEDKRPSQRRPQEAEDRDGEDKRPSQRQPQEAEDREGGRPPQKTQDRDGEDERPSESQPQEAQDREGGRPPQEAQDRDGGDKRPPSQKRPQEAQDQDGEDKRPSQRRPQEAQDRDGGDKRPPSQKRPQEAQDQDGEDKRPSQRRPQEAQDRDREGGRPPQEAQDRDGGDKRPSQRQPQEAQDRDEREKRPSQRRPQEPQDRDRGDKRPSQKQPQEAQDRDGEGGRPPQEAQDRDGGDERRTLEEEGGVKREKGAAQPEGDPPGLRPPSGRPSQTLPGAGAGHDRRRRPPLPPRGGPSPAAPQARDGQPSGVRVRNVTSGGFVLLWDAPEGLFSNFTVTLRESGGPGGDPTVLVVPGASRSLPIQNLRPRTRYLLSFSGKAPGIRSRIHRLSVFTGPEPPSQLAFSNVTDSSFTLSWVRPSAPISSFKITYTHLQEGEPRSLSVGGQQSSAAVSRLRPGSRYEVSVLSVLGLDESRPLTGVVLTVPDAPTDLRAINVTDSRALLLWRPALATVDRYLVLYGAQNVPEVLVSASGNTAELQLKGLLRDTVYTVRVTSEAHGARSSPATLSFSTTGAAAAGEGPRDLGASQVTPRSAVLSWKPPRIAVTGYRLTYHTAAQELQELILEPNVTQVKLSRLAPVSLYTARLQALRGEQRSAALTVQFTTGSLRFPFPVDCSQELLNGLLESGETTIYPGGAGDEPLRVFCDMETDGGGWTVFQRRMNGKTNFFRKWKEYKAGFGNLSEEFWLGNDALHRLTRGGAQALRVDLRAGGESAFAKYSSFSIDTERQHYRLQLSGYSGTAGDSLSYHDGRPFSSRDRDPRPLITRCAMSYRGGWWYRNCHFANLNGLYDTHKNHQGIIWTDWKGKNFSIPFTEMKIRPAAFVPPDRHRDELRAAQPSSTRTGLYTD